MSDASKRSMSQVVFDAFAENIAFWKRSPLAYAPTVANDLSELLTRIEQDCVNERPLGATLAILWEKRPGDYKAWISGQTACWEAGRSPMEAIGKLVNSHPDLFGRCIEVKECI